MIFRCRASQHRARIDSSRGNQATGTEKNRTFGRDSRGRAASCAGTAKEIGVSGSRSRRFFRRDNDVPFREMPATSVATSSGQRGRDSFSFSPELASVILASIEFSCTYYVVGSELTVSRSRAALAANRRLNLFVAAQDAQRAQLRNDSTFPFYLFYPKKILTFITILLYLLNISPIKPSHSHKKPNQIPFR